MGGPLTLKDRALLAAKRRIEYKFARPYIDSEPQTDKELLDEIKRIVEHELGPNERQKLEQDKKLEFLMIERYYSREE